MPTGESGAVLRGVAPRHHTAQPRQPANCNYLPAAAPPPPSSAPSLPTSDPTSSKTSKNVDWKLSGKVASQLRPLWPLCIQNCTLGVDRPRACVSLQKRGTQILEKNKLQCKSLLCDVSHSDRWSLVCSGWTHESECSLQACLQETGEEAEKKLDLPREAQRSVYIIFAPYFL